jgi:hypothetical protein
MDFCWTFAHSDIGRAPGGAKAKMDEVFKVAATDSSIAVSTTASELIHRVQIRDLDEGKPQSQSADLISDQASEEVADGVKSDF